MPGFVADASATLPWCFAEEATPATEALLDRAEAGEVVLVPAQWPTEVMNGLIMAVRRGRIDRERVARFASDLSALPIRMEAAHVDLGCGDQSGHRASAHVYDAAYL